LEKVVEEEEEKEKKEEEDADILQIRRIVGDNEGCKRQPARSTFFFPLGRINAIRKKDDDPFYDTPNPQEQKGLGKKEGSVIARKQASPGATLSNRE
jgi:hypothetical protein